MSKYSFRANKAESESIDYFLSCEISKQYGTTTSEVLKNLVVKAIAAPEFTVAHLPSVEPNFDKPTAKRVCKHCKKKFMPPTGREYFNICSECWDKGLR